MLSVVRRHVDWHRWLLVVALLLVAATANAGVRMQAATLTLPGVKLADVHLQIAVGADGRPEVRLQAAHVAIPALGWRDVALTLNGAPEHAGTGTWKFVGKVATRRAPGDALSDAAVAVTLDRGDGTLEVAIQQGASKLDALLPLDQTTHVQMKLAALPLAWLRGVLEAAWPAGRLNGGTLAGNVALDIAPAATRVSGRVTLADADLDSRGGTLAAQKLGAAGAFLLDTGAQTTSMMFDGDLRGGKLLLGPLYAQLPQSAVGLHVAASVGSAGITLQSVDFDDPDALRLAGALAFDRAGSLTRLDLTHFAATFPAAYTRYGTTLAQRLLGAASLATSGSIAGTLLLDGTTPKRIDVSAHHLTLDSKDGGTRVADLDGRVDWQAGTSRAPTRLKWSSLSLYRLAFGPASVALEDERGALRLRAPVRAGLFGGAVEVSRLAWRPDAGKAQRLSAALAVTDVDMNRLCKALGWPPFGGKLGGAVPDLSYRGNELVFGGGLTINAFGGAASVTDLSLQHPFSAAPQLAANVQLNQLDLSAITGVFGFGKITGRLDGTINGLRLVAWKPTAFAANFAANGGGKISQNAIKSLTEVGGGGIAGGLQSIALRVFKTFGYSHLGLSCTLAGGVCAMGGIVPDPDPDDHGYTIVEGSGLPRITVIGHERQVDWATLVNRLKAVSEGNAPIIK